MTVVTFTSFIFCVFNLILFRRIYAETTLIWSSQQHNSPRGTLYAIRGDPDGWIPDYETGKGVSVIEHTLDHKWTALAVDASIDTIHGFNSEHSIISKTVYTHNTNFNTLDEVNEECSSEVTALAVDWISKNIYWIDDAYNWIMMSSLIRSDLNTHIITSGLWSPKGLAVAPKLGYLFWSDIASVNRKIERSTLSGDERMTIIDADMESSLKKPFDLVFDHATEKLFWLDPTAGAIWRCNAAGADRQRLVQSNEVYAFQSFTIHEKWLFAVVRTENKVKIYRGVNEAALRATSGHLTHANVNSFNYDIRMLSDDIQQGESSPCTGAPCSELCVSKNRNSDYQCLCKYGMIIGQDGVTCIENPNIISPSYFLSFGSTLCRFDVLSPERSFRSKDCVGFDDSGPLAANLRNNRLWMADSETHSIKEYDNERMMIKMELNEDIGGIAVDWTSAQLFWTNSIRGEISAATGAGKFSAKLLTGLSTPTDIALDPLYTYSMYWIESGQSPSIQKSYYDGTVKTRFADARNSRPERLTIDIHEQRLYWTDSIAGKIYFQPLSGSSKTALNSATDNGSGLYGIAVFQEVVAWTERNQKRVCWGVKDRLPTVSSCEVLTEKPGEIISYSEYSQPSEIGTSVCADGGGCEQLCLSTKQGRKCKCALGYTLIEDTKCISEPLSENFLILVDNRRFEMYQISIVDPPDVRAIPIPGMKNPAAVEYDNTTGIVYWSDINEQVIYKAKINDRPITPTVVLNAPSEGSAIYGMVGDWQNHILYYTDEKRGIVAKISTSGGQEQVLFSSLERPRGIEIDTSMGYLFWTEWGAKASIKRGTLGTTPPQVQTITDYNMVWPNGLTLDKSNKLIYWCDASLNKIESMNYKGEDRSDPPLFEEPSSHFYDIAFHAGTLYLTDWNSRHLKVVQKDTFNKYAARTLGPDDFERPLGIKFVPGGIPVPPPTQPNPSPTSGSNGEGGNSLWIIVGAAGGGVLIILIIIIVVVCVRKSRGRKEPRLMNGRRPDQRGVYPTGDINHGLVDQMMSPVALPPSSSGRQQNGQPYAPSSETSYRSNSDNRQLGQQTNPQYFKGPRSELEGDGYLRLENQRTGLPRTPVRDSGNYAKPIPYSPGSFNQVPIYQTQVSEEPPPSYRSTDGSLKNPDYMTPIPRDQTYVDDRKHYNI